MVHEERLKIDDFLAIPAGVAFCLYIVAHIGDHVIAKLPTTNKFWQRFHEWDLWLLGKWRAPWLRDAIYFGMQPIGWLFFPKPKRNKSGLPQAAVKRLWQAVSGLWLVRICVGSLLLSSLTLWGAGLEGASLREIFTSSDIGWAVVRGYVINLVFDGLTIVVTWKCLNRVCRDVDPTAKQRKEIPAHRLGWLFADLVLAVIFSIMCLYFFDRFAVPRDGQGAFADWRTAMLSAVRFEEEAPWMRAIFALTTLLPTLLYALVGTVVLTLKLLICTARLITYRQGMKPGKLEIGPCRLTAMLVVLLSIPVAGIVRLLF